jgi:hypothetical protein
MGLYERLLGTTADEKITVHQFQAVMGERARGALATNAAARDAINSILQQDLSASEEQEAITLLNTIAGSATAKLARAKEIDDVLLLAESGVTGYATPAQVKTRLGV